MRHRLLIVAGFCAAGLLTHAQGKLPVTHEALWLMPRVGAPAVSPDGKWVVMPVTQPAYDDRDQTSDLWLVPSDGAAPPRRLTSTKAAESGVTWSADSRRIAFSTKREGDETNQIYTLDLVKGRDAARVTSISTGAASPKFRPDGSAILFTSLVYPNAAFPPSVFSTIMLICAMCMTWPPKSRCAGVGLNENLFSGIASAIFTSVDF